MLAAAKMPDPASDALPVVPLRTALRLWAKVAVLSFGGPAGQIAVMHRLVVEEKKWVSEERFLHALNYCMLLPGPEAQQLAIYLGWLLNGTLGGLAAGSLFVLPGFLSILALSVLYAGYGHSLLMAGIFFGLKPAVVAVVAEAVVRIGKRALRGRFKVALAVLAFVAIFFFDVPFPWIVLGAALAGWLGRGRLPAGDAKTEAAPEGSGNPSAAWPTVLRSLRVIAVGLSLWFAPLLLLAAWLGRGHTLVQEGVFFSQTAAVTFGGAYAVLAYVAQQAVAHFHWLRPGEMLDGLGMAETTPGPLIQVVQFVGFLGAYRHPGTFSPLVAGIGGSLVTTWVTFVPCFLWIFLGAPYIERLRGQRALTAALSAVTAAIVGVIANLAVWFSLHTLFARVGEVRLGILHLLSPDPSSLDPAALILAILALVAVFRFKLGMIPTLLGCALLGLGWRWMVG
jgi:chromate transporter